MAAARKLSTKHKVYAAVLGVAVMALVYDQCRSSGPTLARAAAPPDVVAPVNPAAEPPIDLAPPAAGLAERLRAVAGATPTAFGEIRNAFAPSAAWAAEGRVGGAAPVAAAAFVAAHRLSVVMVSSRPGGGAAVVGGRLVRIGQTVDGYRLTAVDRRSAHLSGPGGEIDLRMP